MKLLGGIQLLIIAGLVSGALLTDSLDVKLKYVDDTTDNQLNTKNPTPKPPALTPKPTTTASPKPTINTPKATTTTPKPKPPTTTPKPTTTTPKPTTTTRKTKPTTPKPTTTPKQTTTTRKPTTTTPKPTTTTRKPTTTTPKPITTTPKPTTTTPKPTTTTPKPTTTTPKPTTTTPKPTTTPRPSTSDPRANKSVCYGDLGCFDNFYPFDNAALDLPDSPEKIGITLTLYTRQNSEHDKGQLLEYNNSASIKNSHFGIKRGTKIIIHGFSNDKNTEWIHKMKDEFLKNDDFNVIIVGWGNGAKFPDYGQAVANTRIVATVVHRVIEKLLLLGAKLSEMHLLGHSLGAHTCGYVGNLLGGRLPRITGNPACILGLSGLDPAGPDFDAYPTLVILDPTDALFIDVIHSNGGNLAGGAAGLFNQTGHIDFYLNGGKHQPGCDDGLSGLGDILNGKGVAKTLACSHGRSHDAFIESINSGCPFTAYPCSDYQKFEQGGCLDCGTTGCSVLGYYSDQYYARGKMYIDTRDKSPYCGYHYGVTVKGADINEDTTGQLSLRLTGNWGDSGFVPVTKNDASLKKGVTFSHVIVSPEEVGEVDYVYIKYKKYSGFWFGKGKEKYSVEKVEVTSGENGSKYKFCLVDKELEDGTEVKTVKSSAKYHC